MRRTLVPIAIDVDMAAILAYATITDDYNPIHVDPGFAATTPMGGVIAHGTMSMNLLWQAIGASFGVEAASASSIDIRFARPVRAGDRVEAGGVETDRAGVFDVWVRNREGVAVIEGTATVPLLDHRTSADDRANAADADAGAASEPVPAACIETNHPGAD